MEFFIALRKLKKEHIMVFYENDGHSLSNPENQKDMTNRLFDWYDHYLKGAPAPAWMTEVPWPNHDPASLSMRTCPA